MSLSAKALQKFGAKKIYVVATHAVLSGDAPQVLEDSPLEEMWVTDTIELPTEKEFNKLHRLSVADLLKEAIIRVHNHQSIHELFEH